MQLVRTLWTQLICGIHHIHDIYGNHLVQNIENAGAFEMCPQVVTLPKAGQYNYVLADCLFVVVSAKESQ